MEYFYYDDLGQKYYNKFDARRSNRKVHLYFYDKEFMAFDWKTEPRETLSELYRLRAQQLRDKYEYLILAYSGGIDSTNMLETFYYNNIHVDEIIMVGAFSQDSYWGSDENRNGEIYRNCVPTLNMMNLKNTKITYHDYTKFFDTPEKFIAYNNIDKKYQIVDTWFSPNELWWSTPSFLNIDNSKKKKGVVFGIDKPNFCVFSEDEDSKKSKRFMWFNALSVACNGNHTLYNQYSENLNREFFYWTPEMPQILIKQLHMISKFYDEIVVINKKISNDVFYSNYTTIIEKIIYNKIKNPLNFKSSKSSNNILSLRDNYIVKNKNSKIYDDYIKQVAWAQKNSLTMVARNGIFYKNDIRSRKYFIN